MLQLDQLLHQVIFVLACSPYQQALRKFHPDTTQVFYNYITISKEYLNCHWLQSPRNCQLQKDWVMTTFRYQFSISVPD